MLQSKLQQPGAAELLGIVQDECGWQARVEFLNAVQVLRKDKSLARYNREYLEQTLTDEEVEAALVGDAKVIHDARSAVDEPFQRSRAYRGTEGFREMLQVMARFRKYAPFNNMLVHHHQIGRRLKPEQLAHRLLPGRIRADANHAGDLLT